MFEVFSKIEIFIKNYQNGTFKGHYNWAFISVENQINKLETVKKNLLLLNFDSINNLFKEWFKQSLDLWNDIYNENSTIKNEIKKKFVEFNNISKDVTNKIMPKDYPWMEQA